MELFMEEQKYHLTFFFCFFFHFKILNSYILLDSPFPIVHTFTNKQILTFLHSLVGFSLLFRIRTKDGSNTISRVFFLHGCIIITFLSCDGCLFIIVLVGYFFLLLWDG